MTSYSVLGSAQQEGPIGVAAVSARLHEGVTHYHAQIGPDVPKSELTSLEQKLLKEASKAVYAQAWEEALNLFTHALAVSEKTQSSTDAGARGTFVHNIGFCLHCLGEFDAARAYYEQSIDCLRKALETTPRTTKVLNGLLYPERLVMEFLYGGLNHNRIQMTKERILDTTFGRKPDLKILDEWGRKRTMPGVTVDAMTGRAEPREEATLSRKWEEEGVPAPPADARQPGWVGATRAADERSHPSGGAADDADARDAAEQEAARVEWLQYYLKTGDWAQAEELVVTAEEKEDLEYLRTRERREGR
jgi:tetratricopeptide (TPR) repeat protein